MWAAAAPRGLWLACARGPGRVTVAVAAIELESHAPQDCRRSPSPRRWGAAGGPRWARVGEALSLSRPRRARTAQRLVIGGADRFDSGVAVCGGTDTRRRGRSGVRLEVEEIIVVGHGRLLAGRVRWVAVLAVVAAGLPAAPAVAQQPAAGKSVQVLGVGEADVKPKNRRNNASIQRAVDRAEAAALPRAFRAAGVRAAELARLSGLTLGEVISVSDAPASPYGPFGFGPFEGTFGPGRWCGTIRRSVVRRVDGRRRRVTRTRRVCHFPSEVYVSVTVTYAAS
jgi:hypothetical protein